MMDHALVLIGASAGGVEAVRDVVTALPADLEATVLVVVHIDGNATSALPEILSRSGSLPATHPHDGDDLEPGRILVGPPDRHLVVGSSNVRLTRGPKESNHRPSVDVLFRSGAADHGPSVIGVVASGNLDDGTLGLIAIKAAGGTSVAQDPDTARFPSMPLSVIVNDHIDQVAAPYAIADVISEFASADRGLTGVARRHRQHASELRDNAETIRGTLGTLSGSTVSQEHVR